jgi:hypothetical protein
LAELHAAPYELLTTSFTVALSRGLLVVGRPANGAALIEQRIATMDTREDRCYLPELLRFRAHLLSTAAGATPQAVEACLEQALELSRRQGAHGWELRAAIEIAELWLANGRGSQARDLLEQLVGSCVEGHVTTDLKSAIRLLNELRGEIQA